MCKAKPGARCATDTRKDLDKATAALNDARERVDVHPREVWRAEEAVERAQMEYDATRTGLDELERDLRSARTAHRQDASDDTARALAALTRRHAAAVALRTAWAEQEALMPARDSFDFDDAITKGHFEALAHARHSLAAVEGRCAGRLVDDANAADVQNAVRDYGAAVQRVWNAERRLLQRQPERYAAERTEAAAALEALVAENTSRLSSRDRRRVRARLGQVKAAAAGDDAMLPAAGVMLDQLVLQRSDPALTTTFDQTIPPLPPAGWVKFPRALTAGDTVKVARFSNEDDAPVGVRTWCQYRPQDDTIRISPEVSPAALQRLWRAGYRIDMSERESHYTVAAAPDVVAWRKWATPPARHAS